jgi:hypothetical protein
MAKEANFAWSPNGLRLAEQISRKDFRFVCGSDALSCDRFQAASISPRIANLLSSDPTIDEFSISPADSRTFAVLSNLISGESLAIDDGNVEAFTTLIESLGNIVLSASVFEFIEAGEELSVSNCASRIEQKSRLGLTIARERDLICTHLSEFSVDDLRGLDLEFIRGILQSDSIRIESEDWLFHFVLELGQSHLTLLGDVRFEYLSSSSIDEFFERIDFDELDSRIWQQLWNRCLHPIFYGPKEIQWNRFIGLVKRSPDAPWSGLIFHLTEFCGGNVHENGLVNITSSGDRSNHCWDLVNREWNDFWFTNNAANSWVQFDFKDRVVSLSHYTLKSDGDSGHPLLQWKLEGSADGSSWTVLDRRNTQDLNGNYVTKVSSCGEMSSQGHFYRYLRLTQTGKNSSNDDHLLLSEIEFFGSMVNCSSIGGLCHQTPSQT